ncbi:MAG TPA: hypothetical protein DEQ40_00305 [Oxalobacteraceae bacterium]|nr:hypothetical protein [Oxalobacteraceae bacterium]
MITALNRKGEALTKGPNHRAEVATIAPDRRIGNGTTRTKSAATIGADRLSFRAAAMEHADMRGTEQTRYAGSITVAYAAVLAAYNQRGTP